MNNLTKVRTINNIFAYPPGYVDPWVFTFTMVPLFPHFNSTQIILNILMKFSVWRKNKFTSPALYY